MNAKKMFFISILLLNFLNVNALTLSLVEPNNYPFESNQAQTISVLIYNEGLSSETGLSIGLDLRYPFFSVGGEAYRIKIPTLSPKQTIIKSFRINTQDSVPEAEYELNTYYCYDECNSKIIKDLGVQFSSSSKVSVKSYVFSQTTILPGKEINLSLTVVNQGQGNSRNTYVELSNQDADGKKPFVFLGESNKRYLGTLNQGESSKTVYKLLVNPDIEPGVYNLDVIISNEDGNETAGQLSFRVNDIAELDISSISTDPIQVIKNSEFSMQINLDNAGTGRAKRTRIQIITKDFETSNYLGTIEGEDDEIALIDLPASSEDFEIILYYEDDLGEHQTSSKYVLKTISQKKSLNKTQILLGLILLVLVYNFFIKKVRSKKRKQ